MVKFIEGPVPSGAPGTLFVGGSSGSVSVQDRFNVKAFGAVGDNITDDRAAIQATFDAAKTAGGGVIFFPPGAYRLIATSSAGGMTWHLAIEADNITLDFATGAKLVSSVASVRTLVAIGGSKPSGQANWATNTNAAATLYALTGSYVKGANKLTLATAGNAANFATGDYVYIRTGQCLSGSSGEPDSELNQVLASDATAGTLTLKWPLTKAYAQEYFISGTTGLTSTAVTANLALYGVSKVTDRTLVNLHFHNLTIETSGLTGQALSVWQAVRWTWAGGEMDYATDCHGSREVRFADIGHVRLRHTAYSPISASVASATATTVTSAVVASVTANQYLNYGLHIVSGTGAGQGRQINSHTSGTAPVFTTAAWSVTPDATSVYALSYSGYFLAPSTGCTNWNVHDCEAVSNYGTYLHIHEGIAASRFHHNSVNCSFPFNEQTPISVRARGHDLVIDHNHLYANYGSESSGVLIDVNMDGGIFAYNTLICPTGVDVRMDSSAWSGLDTNKLIGGGRISMRGAQVGLGHDTGIHVLSGWVLGATANPQLTVTLGVLPRHAIPLRIGLYVKTAFDSSGTDNIKLGHTSTTAYFTDTDVSTTGIKAPVAGASLLIPEDSQDRVVLARYTAGGGAPTVGEAFVTLEYALGARRD